MKFLENYKQNFIQMPNRSKSSLILAEFFGGLVIVSSILSLLNINDGYLRDFTYLFLFISLMLDALTDCMIGGFRDFWNPNRKYKGTAILLPIASGFYFIVVIVDGIKLIIKYAT